MSTVSATNASYATQTKISAELEDKIMAALPKRLADWLRYEATTDICTAAVFRLWRAGNREDNILATLRGDQRKKTRALYGAEHPQASFV